MKRVSLVISLFSGLVLAPLVASGQAGNMMPAMSPDQRECMLAIRQLEALSQVASQARAQAITAVQQRCAYDKELVERALRNATGVAAGSAGCTAPISSKSFEFVPGETCESKQVRESLAAARSGAQPQPDAYQTPEARVYLSIIQAIAQSKLLLPPGENAWDLLRSPEAARLSVAHRTALNREFDAEAKKCFNAAMNQTPERIEQAKVCLEAISLVSPNWEHMQRDRRRLAVAINPVGVTVHGVEAVLAGRAPPQAPAGIPSPNAPLQPARQYGGIGNAIVELAELVGIPSTQTKPAPAGNTQDPGADSPPSTNGTTQATTAAMQTSGEAYGQRTLQPSPAGYPQTGSAATQGLGGESVAAAPSPRVAPVQPPPTQVAQAPVSTPARENPFALPASDATRQRSAPAPVPAPAVGNQPVVYTASQPAPAAPVNYPSPARVAPARAPAPRQRKVALVIGNSGYIEQQWPPLKNTVNDVHLVGGALGSIGFEVTRLVDLTRDGMIDALAEFSRKAKGADIATIYYAGHAVQINGKNILMPTDARGKELISLEGRGLDAEQLRSALSGAAFRMLVLDSCRDNPFSSRVRTGGQYVATRGAGDGGGLAKMKADDGQGNKGSVIIFSTAEGEAALDFVQSETETNSPFAKVFAQSVVSPGVPMQTMLIRIQSGVEKLTNSEQQPFTDNGLLDEAVFLAD